MRLFIRSRHLPRAQAQMRTPLPLRLVVLTSALAVFILSTSPHARAQGQGDRDAFLPNPVRSVSTVPANGDVNPYGVAFVPKGFAPASATPMKEGDVLVSNFNNSGNLQGTGTTIIRIPRKGKVSTFFQGQMGEGLSTALNVLKSGYVLVGNFPSTDGTCATANAGSILVISPSGHLLRSIANKVAINGPGLFDGMGH